MTVVAFTLSPFAPIIPQQSGQPVSASHRGKQPREPSLVVEFGQTHNQGRFPDTPPRHCASHAPPSAAHSRHPKRRASFWVLTVSRQKHELAIVSRAFSSPVRFSRKQSNRRNNPHGQ